MQTCFWWCTSISLKVSWFGSVLGPPIGDMNSDLADFKHNITASFVQICESIQEWNTHFCPRVGSQHQFQIPFLSHITTYPHTSLRHLPSPNLLTTLQLNTLSLAESSEKFGSVSSNPFLDPLYVCIYIYVCHMCVWYIYICILLYLQIDIHKLISSNPSKIIILSNVLQKFLKHFRKGHVARFFQIPNAYHQCGHFVSRFLGCTGCMAMTWHEKPPLACQFALKADMRPTETTPKFPKEILGVHTPMVYPWDQILGLNLIHFSNNHSFHIPRLTLWNQDLGHVSLVTLEFPWGNQSFPGGSRLTSKAQHD